VQSAVWSAACEVVLEVGIAGFGIAEVARRAGVHETTIYRRWGSSESLLLDALLERSRLSLPAPDTGTLRGDLIAFASALADYLNSPFGEALDRLMASAVDHPGLESVRAEFWDRRWDETRVVIDRAVERGEVSADCDGRLLIECLIAPLHLRTLLTRKPITAELIAALADLLLEGCSRHVD